MTPFGEYLRQLRKNRKMRQKVLAYELNVEASYISALERGVKGAPGKEFVERVVQVLFLTEEETAQLKKLLHVSQRRISIPCHASVPEYLLVHHLFERLGSLCPIQIQLIQLALTVVPGMDDQAGMATRREDHIM